MMKSPQWLIDLTSPPRVVLLGTATHGEMLLSETYYSHHWVLLFFKYHGEVGVDAHTLEVQPGMLGLFPPATELLIRYYGPSQHHYAHLALPGGRAGEVVAQAATHLGQNAGEIEKRYTEAIRHFAMHPERSAMLLWELLWFVVEHTPANADATNTWPPTVARIIGRIEQRLAEPVDLPSLVEGLGFSQRHLSAQFLEATGSTIGGYLRARRVERAKKLLCETRLPIKRIAADVGVPNLQQFNKFLRSRTGNSPRQWRTKFNPGASKGSGINY